MIGVVIDTNVLISSVIEPRGKPAEIMNLCFFEKIRLYYTEEIFNEYKKVLSYERLNIDFQTQTGILDAIGEIGVLVNPVISDIPMPDETDRIFYDAAREGKAILITGNKKHFPKESFILTPADFLRAIL
jgi:putative PIN family toxin of toxin-antitoxin system